MIEVGKSYYFVAHAYYHYIGTVVTVLGVRRVTLTNVVQVHSSARNWTRFFEQGLKSGDKYDVLPDAVDLGFLTAFEWPHPIPRERQA